MDERVCSNGHEELHMLRTLQDIHAFERSIAEETSGDVQMDAVRVVVRGQFVRKRKLS